MTITLRDYQRDSISSIFSYWEKGGGNALVEMATGVGKSVVIAELTRKLMTDYPDIRVLMLVHVRELVRQNLEALINVWPQANVGINSAGLRRRDCSAPIIFASIQSVYKHAQRLGQRDLVIIDECHLVPHDGDGMYRRLLSELEAPYGMRVAGFTATAYRLQSGRLDEGDGRLFDKIIYRYGIAQGISDGYLSPLISKATATVIDVSSVSKRGGEFVVGALENAVNKDWITRSAVDEIIKYGANRRSWLTFCTGVKHANDVADEISSRGISCRAITEETSEADRDRFIREFKNGQIKCLTNAMVLTTGFDAPYVDMIAMLRPTLSTGLYVQMCGRGTRLANGKQNCLILDYGRNIERHGPVDAVEIRDTKEKNGEEKVMAKQCPDCDTLVGLAALTCPSCGHEWPPREEAKHEATADAQSTILSTADPAWIDVNDVYYFRHEKQGGQPSLRVEYQCGLVCHREWICLEHIGFARQKAEQWWLRTAQTQVPRTVDEAFKHIGELRTPTAIQVRPDGKFFRITGRRFARQMEAVG